MNCVGLKCFFKFFKIGKIQPASPFQEFSMRKVLLTMLKFPCYRIDKSMCQFFIIISSNMSLSMDMVGWTIWRGLASGFSALATCSATILQNIPSKSWTLDTWLYHGSHSSSLHTVYCSLAIISETQNMLMESE